MDKEKELRHIYFPTETVRILEEIAEEEERKVNNLITKIVIDFVKSYKDGN